MDHESRMFIGVLLHGDSLKSPDAVVKLLPRRHIKSLQSFDIPGLRSPAVHFFFKTSNSYSSLSRYSPADDLCCYDVYVVRAGSSNRFLVTAPFSGVAKELLGHLVARSQGLGMRYSRVNLLGLLQAMLRGDHQQGAFKLTRIEMQVEGETDTRTISLSGRDVPHSLAFERVQEALEEEALQSTLRKCRILYDDPREGRLWLETDRWGQYNLRIRGGGLNLHRLDPLFNFLCDRKLLEESYGPPRLVLQDDDDA